MLEPKDIQKLRGLTNLESLVDYLRDELDWPIEAEDTEKITFSYKISDLGIDQRYDVKIKDIHQIRPLAEDQPWGVFYLEFESKELPVLVLRRILRSLVPSSRYSNPDKPIWKKSDLLFISSQGVNNNRSISFAHFRQDASGKDELRTFSWDVRETHLYYIKNLNLKALRWPEDDTNVQSWREEWSKAFTVRHREVPQTAEMLANEMARIGREIREAVTDVYNLEHVGGPLHQLHLSLKMDLINDLSEADFADMYAQTVTYGLFAARATHTGGFQQEDAPAMIAHTNPFLRELLQQMMDQHTLDLDELGVNELTELLNKVNMDAILQSFGVQKRGEDPVIHFYETFMRAYDPVQKMRRGEFYTPDPVVSFIVRSVDYLLRTEFDCKDGLATVNPDPNAFQPVVLDPATGTGTFLKYVIEVIWETFYNKHKNMSAAEREVKWNQFVRQYVLPRLYAFELKMSPYTIAHMKVGLALQQKGFKFEEGERLHIYLSNALQPGHEIGRIDTPALAHEIEHSNNIKLNSPITVLLGNPPYSNFGMMNKGPWILKLLEDYKNGLNEKKLNLDDDYIKFFRFAQWKLQLTGQGILAFITSHSYLDAITHRLLRYNLLSTFDKLFILNLHGNSRITEKVPSGIQDSNVFDIQQGVSITIGVRNSTGKKNSDKGIYYSDLWGSREEKYQALITQGLSSIDWKLITPQPPYYFFTPKDFGAKHEYNLGINLSDIFIQYQNGIKTDRDDLFFDFDYGQLAARMVTFFSPKGLEPNFTNLYRVENSSSYNLLVRRNSFEFDKSNIIQCLYRPFDVRWLYYKVGLTSRPAWDIMQHIMNKRNLVLLAKRQSKREPFSYIWCSNTVIESTVFESAYANNSAIPLYLNYLNVSQRNLFEQQQMITSIQVPNLSSTFITILSKKINLEFIPLGQGNFITTYGPENIFHYMYAIFHSPSYRHRYAEFLKIDYPRLPLTSNRILFSRLCRLGEKLVSLHLMESPAIVEYITTFIGQGDGSVTSGYPKYVAKTVWINPNQGFEGVPGEVWNFNVGGYQVCHKWLKDRRGRTLSTEDIDHYQKVVVALNETIRIMGEIDDVIEDHGGWPIV